MGTNFKTGTDGPDILRGNPGNNTMHGLGGNDIIFGAAGDDTIIGGAGRDVLYGSSGADTYVYESAADSNIFGGYDVIVGFKFGTDKIDLSALNVTGADLFFGTKDAGTHTFLRVDLAGADLVVQLNTTTLPTLADIIL